MGALINVLFSLLVLAVKMNVNVQFRKKIIAFEFFMIAKSCTYALSPSLQKQHT